MLPDESLKQQRGSGKENIGIVGSKYVLDKAVETKLIEPDVPKHRLAVELLSCVDKWEENRLMDLIVLLSSAAPCMKISAHMMTRATNLFKAWL